MPEDFEQRLPALLPFYDADTDIGTWVDAHSDEVDRLDDSLEGVKKSLQIANAETIQSLELIGADFGVLGKRRGRPKEVYRSYLMSLVQSFKGRGTNPGVRTAIAAGLAIEKDDVELIEDFANNKYEVRLLNWTPHRSGTVRTMAELADPVAIERLEPVHNVLDENEVAFVGDTTALNRGMVLDTAETVFETRDATAETTNSVDTFGTGRFDGEDSFS